MTVRHPKHLRFALLLFVAVAMALLPAAGLAAGPPPTQGVRLRMIGHPRWTVADFHLFAAPIGTAASGYAEFLQTALALLPEPSHRFHPALFVGPGDPHARPYTSELAVGVAAQGFHEGVRFNKPEFSNGMGVYLVWMNVPAPGTTGSSPDFTSGPIIPNWLFPIHVEGSSAHNGAPFSFLGATDVPKLDVNLDPPFNVDGHSHFPMFFVDNADFGPPGAQLRGSYEWTITMTDALGNGWRVEARFTVGP
ncbi:hypothetical protein [Candidatus Amarolinea aalborgensis]|jgi:hypothetical protein|uniref:hypothetical protein n=1 Tax=Candidatus Amarolinea aalborgensis TaxID=2249329 RepID=UPI003BFA37A1